MVKRVCPNCGRVRYSAIAEKSWLCKCGHVLSTKLNMPVGNSPFTIVAQEKKESAGGQPAQVRGNV